MTSFSVKMHYMETRSPAPLLLILHFWENLFPLTLFRLTLPVLEQSTTKLQGVNELHICRHGHQITGNRESAVF